MGENLFEWWEEGAGANGSFDDGFEQTGGFGKVFLKGEFLDHDIVKIFVETSDVQTPVLGIAFHLKYDPLDLSFLRYDPGDFLEVGGDPFYLVTAVKDDIGDERGEIYFGETLRRDDQFPVGDGNVAAFYFQELARGRGADGEALSADGEALSADGEALSADGESVSADGESVSYEFNFENGVVSTLDTVRQDIDSVVFEDFTLVEGAEVPGSSDVSDGNFAASYLGANLSGGLSLGNGHIIWMIIACAVFFSAAFWYFFKRKKKPKFANFDMGG